MTEQLYMTFFLNLDESDFSHFMPLLQKGFHVKTEVGRSVRYVLCEQCHVGDEYLAERIQTIFLEGKVVDNVDTTTVKNGVTLALSAAMPGLAGATLRSGGLLAGFRDGITHQEEAVTAGGHEMGMVKIKLFNLLMAELGPLFLNEGVWVAKEDAEALVREWGRTLPSILHSAERDGQEIAREDLADVNWDLEPDYVFLKGAA